MVVNGETLKMGRPLKGFPNWRERIKTRNARTYRIESVRKRKGSKIVREKRSWEGVYQVSGNVFHEPLNN